MKLPDAIASRLGWINVPTAFLVAFLQRAPAVRVAAAVEEMVVASPISAILKSAAATAASLGAMQSLAGATTGTFNSSSPSPLIATVGTAIGGVAFSITGVQQVESWRVTSDSMIPPGLNVSGLTGPGVVNVTVSNQTVALTGTPSAAGIYIIKLIAYNLNDASGLRTDPASYVIIVNGNNVAAPSFTTQPQSKSATVGDLVMFTAAASGSPTYRWQKDHSDMSDGGRISGATTETLTLNGVQLSDGGSYSVVATNSGGSTPSAGATLTVNAGTATPSITTQPTSETVVSGSTVVFNSVASGSPTPTYQWYLNNTAISGATSARLVIAGATSANAGSYTVVASNSAGSATSNPATLAFTGTSNPGRLINLSVLSNVQGTLTAGFVIGGAGTSGSENLLIRATGPALAPAPFNVPNVLSDPTLSVNQQLTSTIVASNSGWGTPSSNVAVINSADSAVGAFALTDSSSKDSALVTSLSPSTGGYTVQVKGASGDSGNALTEVYDATASYTVSTSRLVNLSCLTQVSAGGTLTAGFVIGGTTARTVLVRATGPALALAPFNVGGTMPDPQIKIQALGGSSSVLASNAGWGGDSQITATDSAVGAFALTDPASQDSVVLLTLTPGPYTAQVTSVSGAGGFALVEVYEVP